jgi:biotin carboxyl carrier protein
MNWSLEEIKELIEIFDQSKTIKFLKLEEKIAGRMLELTKALSQLQSKEDEPTLVVLKSKWVGKIKEVIVEEGTLVNKGETLAKISMLNRAPLVEVRAPAQGRVIYSPELKAKLLSGSPIDYGFELFIIKKGG